MTDAVDPASFRNPRWPGRPIALGDQLALDFLNSVASPQGEVVDWIRTGADLIDWLQVFEAITATEAAEIRDEWDAPALDAVAREAVVWREEFRGLVGRMASEGRSALREEDMQSINRWLLPDESVCRLESDDGGIALHRRRLWRDPAQMMAPVALAAADMIADGDWGTIRRCENPACTIWFQDRTKGHRRRWCSQALCGNRFKVAAFRQRQKRDR